jgi:hypothetical protein
VAFQRVRRAHWPATFEAALADDYFARLLRCAARTVAADVAAHNPPAPRRRPTPPRAPRIPSYTFDPRRLAANDKDD